MSNGNKVGQEVDSKFNDAISTDISEDDGGMDEFFEETFGDEEQGGGGVADYDEDLGYGQEGADEEGAGDEGEAAAGEEEAADDAGEEEAETAGEEAAEGEEEGAEADGEGKEAAASEDEGEGEEGDDEPFYDAQRDFGDDAVPTMYKDRMSLNHGLVAKVSYFKQLNDRLQEAGSDIGAISLPGTAKGSPENLDQFADVSQVISMSDEDAKEMVKEMDGTLKNMKRKAERAEKAHEKEQKKDQLSQEYQQSQQQAQRAMQELDLEVTKDMTDQQIIDAAYNRLENFESNEENLDNMSQQEFIGKLRKLEDAVFAIEDFAKVAAEHEQAKQSDTKQNEKVTPEQIESSFKEFMQDQPSLDMVKNNRREMQKSLIQTAIRKNWPLGTPRDWLNNYQKFMDIVNANRAQKGMKKLNKDGEEKGGGKEKGGNDNSNKGRATQYDKNKKPSARGNGTTYSNRTDKKQIDDIDDEIDNIAAELVSGSDLDDEGYGW